MKYFSQDSQVTDMDDKPDITRSGKRKRSEVNMQRLACIDFQMLKILSPSQPWTSLKKHAIPR